MRQPRRQWFFNMGDRHALKRVALGLAIVVGVFVLAMVQALERHLPWLMPFAFLGYMLALFWMVDRSVYNGEPAYWRVGRRGLAAIHLLWWRSYPWASIHDVAQTEDGAVLQTTRGAVPLGVNTLNWRKLADVARLHIGQEVVPEVEDDLEVTIPPATVAAWLGLAPGESLHLRGRMARHIALVVLALAAVTGLQGLLTHSWFPFLNGVGCGALGGLAGGLWVRHAMRHQNANASEIRATGEALEVKCQQGWRSIPWGALRSLESRSWNTHILSTTSGDVILAQWFDKRRLLPALEQAIAARRAGEVLPRVLGGDVPAAALSRAGGEAVVAERGVSRAEA